MLFDDSFKGDLFNWNNSNFSDTDTTIPAVNIKENADNFTVEVAAPGMKKEDFKISLDGDTLTISSEKSTQEEKTDERYARKEFSYQSFQRTFNLHDEVVDKGATIKFNDDIVAFVPTRHLEKEDGSMLKKGDEAEFQIIEFNKEFKKVVASHMSIHKEEEAKIVKEAVKKQVAAEAEAKPTLGDANAKLQELKDRMDGKK